MRRCGPISGPAPLGLEGHPDLECCGVGAALLSRRLRTRWETRVRTTGSDHFPPPLISKPRSRKTSQAGMGWWRWWWQRQA
jgi:hypothetical protein